MGLKYFEIAESMNIYSTLNKFDHKASTYELELHSMRRNPATFAVIHFLKLLKKINKLHGIDKNGKYEIITGIGYTSIGWKPVIKPHTMTLLDKRLSHSISYHAPSYNEGVIILDNESLETYFGSNKVLKLKG